MRLDHLKRAQIKLSAQVIIKPLKKDALKIGGVDVAAKENSLYAWITVMTHRYEKVIDNAWAKVRLTMPYIPGYLSFREIPAILKAYTRLTVKPDLIIVDGQGIAHPRFCGLASHLGVLLKLPSIGCAKSHLYGDYKMPASKRGCATLLKAGNKKIGLVLRTQHNVKPVFVSPGHLVDFDDCRHYVLKMAKRYRIPEPLRLAHQGANKVARRKNE